MDTDLTDWLRTYAAELMRLARSVSNMGRPESDNNYGREATRILEAVSVIEQQASRLDAVQAECDTLKNKLNADSQAFQIECHKQEIALLRSSLNQCQALLDVRESLLRRFSELSDHGTARESGLLFEHDVRRHLKATKGLRLADSIARAVEELSPEELREQLCGITDDHRGVVVEGRFTCMGCDAPIPEHGYCEACIEDMRKRIDEPVVERQLPATTCPKCSGPAFVDPVEWIVCENGCKLPDAFMVRTERRGPDDPRPCASSPERPDL